MKNRLIFILMMELIFIAVFSSCGVSDGDVGSEISFMQYANSSSGSYWEYELSTDEILTETAYSTSKTAGNFGPGYKQYWTFEIIGEGEVTVRWLAYEGDTYDESKSYNVTYIF